MFVAAVTAALTASLVAGIGGVFFNMDSKVLGGIALVPGFVAAIATSLKLQARANFHYRKRYILDGLWRRLRYELPDPPDAVKVAAVSSAWTELENTSEDLWEKGFRFSWEGVTKTGEPGQKD